MSSPRRRPHEYFELELINSTKLDFYQSDPCIETDVSRRPFNRQLITKNGENEYVCGMVFVIHSNASIGW